LTRVTFPVVIRKPFPVALTVQTAPVMLAVKLPIGMQANRPTVGSGSPRKSFL
jgi:hypothetical protein